MKTNDEMLIDSVEEYVKDVNSTYAVLITGPWGTGKTYFVKNVLFNKLQIIAPGKTHYLSLSGISDIDEISKEIFVGVELIKDFVSVGTNLARTVVPKIFPSISLIDFEKISEILNNFSKKLKDCVLIMDDYERCKCDQTELLGYIGQLVEHSGCKVIIVANDNEIDNIEEYKKLKEKVIGYTFYYTISYLDIIDDLNSKYLNSEGNSELLKILESNKCKIWEVAREYNHLNLRTYIFFLSIINRIYNVYQNEKLLNYILGYVFEISVRYKKNMDAEGDFDKMVNYIYNAEVKEIIIKLIYDGLIDQEYSKPVLEKFAKEINGNIFDANDPVHILAHWDEHSNEEIISAMTDIKNKLKNREYGSEACSRIILYSCHLFENGFEEEQCRDICDKVCEYLDNSEDFDFKIELSRFNMKENVDYSFYNKYSEKIKQINLMKSQNSLENKLSSMLDSDDWGVLLEQYFGSISHIDNQQLFKHLDKEKLISKIKELDRVQLKHFILSLENRYASDNYYQYLSGDLEYLTDLYNEISSISKTGETATNYQLNLLEEKLQNYIKNMSDYRGKKNNNVDSGDSKNAMTTA